MTKKEMIERMQEKEANNWEEMERLEKLFGEQNRITKRARHKWATIYRLMDELGVESNRF